MKDEYYRLRGWDKESGRQTKKKLTGARPGFPVRRNGGSGTPYSGEVRLRLVMTNQTF